MDALRLFGMRRAEELASSPSAAAATAAMDAIMIKKCGFAIVLQNPDELVGFVDDPWPHHAKSTLEPERKNVLAPLPAERLQLARLDRVHAELTCHPRQS